MIQVSIQVFHSFLLFMLNSKAMAKWSWSSRIAYFGTKRRQSSNHQQQKMQAVQGFTVFGLALCGRASLPLVIVDRRRGCRYCVKICNRSKNDFFSGEIRQITKGSRDKDCGNRSKSVGEKSFVYGDVSFRTTVNCCYCYEWIAFALLYILLRGR